MLIVHLNENELWIVQLTKNSFLNSHYYLIINAITLYECLPTKIWNRLFI